MTGHHPTPAEAAAALEEVAAAEEAATWRPNRWAAALVSLIFGVSVAFTTWERIGWVIGLFLALAAVAFLLRRKLSNPRVRKTDWMDRKDGRPNRAEKWGSELFPLWMPLTILLPPEPRFIGLLVGVAAGVHVHYFFIESGKVGHKP